MLHRTIVVATIALSASAASGLTACAQEPPTAQQIAGAVSPLPETLQEGAAVMGYRGGRLVSLRDGSNSLICLADNPKQEGFHAACYHEDLEPFMARGRALRAEGHQRPAIDSARQAEIEQGTLAMPREPRALYSLSSEQEFDHAAGPPTDASGLYVIYMPYATEETTGIATQPAGDRPWLMFPGKPWAHVMISR
jgi:hypothetical protein